MLRKNPNKSHILNVLVFDNSNSTVFVLQECLVDVEMPGIHVFLGIITLRSNQIVLLVSIRF